MSGQLIASGWERDQWDSRFNIYKAIKGEGESHSIKRKHTINFDN